MKPERWQQIDKILEAALEREEGERSAFLEKACAGDDSLRKEVESLLAADEQAESLIKAPAVEMVAEGFAKDQVESLEGRQIGSYKILSLLGTGGMGAVYLAQDNQLDRKVALKFLPEELQQDSTAKKRFLREAKSAAALDHPFICHIHEVGEAEDKSFISMEYVQGETLKDKLAQGPLPLKDALEKATEVAEAMEAAHKQGIVHRDLKPSNIMLTPQGHVKVMDFGLAKQVTPVEGQEQEITTALTQQGSTLGTIPYMSPEQVRGKVMDTRSDIFSFGVVLYEMLTGVNPFKGDTSVDTSHAILGEAPPPLTRYTDDIPVLLQHTVRKMLAKEPDQRYQLVHEVRTDLGELIEEKGDSISEVATRPSGVSSAAGWWQRPTAIALMVLAGAALAAFVGWNLRPAPSLPVTRTVVALQADETILPTTMVPLALSPDGSHMVYSMQKGNDPVQLYLRPMNSLEDQFLSGTEGASNPFFSPDGQWVGFFTGGELKKVPTTGGAALTICGVSGRAQGASWGPDDRIIFSTVSGSQLLQVSADGGKPETLSSPESSSPDSANRWPEILPGGQAVLFATNARRESDATIVAQRLDTGESIVLLQGGTFPHYVSTGHIVYHREGTLMAVPFDLDQLEISASPVPVIEGVLSPGMANGGAQFTISRTGTLAYIAGSAEEWASRMVWVDRRGTPEPLPAPPRDYRFPRVSPDGQRVAAGIREDELHVWVYDIPRTTLTRQTFEGETNNTPTWSPDGKRIAFASTREGPLNMFWQMADGSGGVERLTTHDYQTSSTSFSPDGQLLAFIEDTPETGRVIRVLNLADREAETFLRTRYEETAPKFSPDGKWMAYVSDESGQREVYVQSYPGPGGKRQISTDGGQEPVWNPQGGELFYRSGNKMMAVAVNTTSGFTAGTPQMLFEGTYLQTAFSFPYYDVSPDGQRFLMLEPVESQTGGATHINVILNWFEELKRLVPTN